MLFVVDTTRAITAADYEVADLLRRTKKPVLLIANKAENREREAAAVGSSSWGSASRSRSARTTATASPTCST